MKPTTEENSQIEDHDPKLTDQQIQDLVDKVESGEVEETPEMDQYEEETGKYAVWRGKVTEGFKKWLKGEKVYNRDKDRISLYVSADMKDEWQEFIKKHNISTISKLIRQSVGDYIDQNQHSIKGNNINTNLETISNLSHALKEPLTTIKGFSQLLLENNKEEISNQVATKIESIFEQSCMLENKIKNILEDIKEEPSSYDILLVEDDPATIRLLTNYFENKGYSINGVVSGTRGLQELKHSEPKVILLDIILPDISGYDLCKAIKNDEDLKEIPVYILTAIPGSEVEKKMDEIKADGIILKPFDFSDFSEVIGHLEQPS
ncbi:MAG: response regulator [Promethearchaeota archaeon]|nr:MAG: response regulator [Candidatus Lokiarchaeota archaeon]